MKFEFLMTLNSVLRHGSFASAADDMGLTPSAVSLQMKRLEEYVGQPLFDRSGRTVRPTPLASDLAESIRTALDAVEEARTRHSAALSGRVVIGAIRSLQPTMIPLVLREIGDRHPGLAVRVIQGDSGELLDHLKAGRLDGAALIRPTSGGSSRLNWQDLERQPFVFVAPPDSTETTAEALIARYDWIQFDTSLTSGRTAASHLHRLSPGTRPRFELESIEAVLAMVSAGLGVSIIPRLPVAPTVRAPVRQIPLGVSTPTRQIAFVCRNGDADNRRVRAIRDAFANGYGITRDDV
ncbi:LysR family transcriptional regulator [Brevundimonas bullata]|uniref:LysR family transcriptional regulator n=1 Tax=Brevundimonas bullata TaxID=13160 RepID=UPI0013B44616|nr:LysR family transcriptional regulator [Brevundimonas bullata]WQE35810.1 LysR family transcriptional regulator [Brevundimonas bullata]